MKKSEAKEQMLRAAMTLFRQRGFEGVGVAEVLAASGAPRGSLYFHFPGGKTQIVREAIRLAGDTVLERARARRAAHATAEAYIESAMASWTRELEASAYQNGCLVAIAALESATHAPEIVEMTRDVFHDWENEIAVAAHDWGMADADAQAFASAFVGAIEGAIVLARAQRSPKPFADAGRALKALAKELLSSSEKVPA